MQIFTEEQADRFSFDVLDATKIVPEELVPLTPVGRMVLNRNPDNFFTETEQVAFCAAHIVPGLDFTNDPLLAGRIHSYIDTQISRLGGPNFHEIPINAPVAQVHNNQRDGMQRQAIARGRVAYEPNSLAGGCPFQAGMAGFTSFPQPVREDKVRGKPELFADHYTQATLFWNSQTTVERMHIVRAFRFELTRVQTPAVRERVVAMLANVADELASQVAEGLGIDVPAPLPLAPFRKRKPEVKVSSALSLLARPGETGIRTRRVAILIADGVEGNAAKRLHAALAERGAVPRFVGPRLGSVATSEGDQISVDVTLEATPSVLYDALALPDGEKAYETLGDVGFAPEFVKDQYRHCKPILVLGAASDFVENAGVPKRLPDGNDDPGLIFADDVDDGLDAFVAAIAKHRHFERETDPPII
jgi:catalase